MEEEAEYELASSIRKEVVEERKLKIERLPERQQFQAKKKKYWEIIDDNYALSKLWLMLTVDADLTNASEEDMEHYSKVVNSKVQNITRQRKYNWQQIDFTRHKGLTYMVSYCSHEYQSIIYR